MPEVLGDPPSPRTALFWNGAAWQWALVDAAGHLQIDALSMVMDPLAATAAAQALALAQLQLIEDMRDALQSVATDRLIVRGEDQVFSFRSTLRFVQTGNPSGASGFLDTINPTANEIWVVTNVRAMDSGTALTGVQFHDFAGAVEHCFYEERRAIPIGEWAGWSGHLYLVQDDVIRVYFQGCGAGDTVYIAVTGHMMTLEV